MNPRLLGGGGRVARSHGAHAEGSKMASPETHEDSTVPLGFDGIGLPQSPTRIPAIAARFPVANYMQIKFAKKTVVNLVPQQLECILADLSYTKSNSPKNTTWYIGHTTLRPEKKYEAWPSKHIACDLWKDSVEGEGGDVTKKKHETRGWFRRSRPHTVEICRRHGACHRPSQEPPSATCQSQHNSSCPP